MIKRNNSDSESLLEKISALSSAISADKVTLEETVGQLKEIISRNTGPIVDDLKSAVNAVERFDGTKNGLHYALDNIIKHFGE